MNLALWAFSMAAGVFNNDIANAHLPAAGLRAQLAEQERLPDEGDIRAELAKHGLLEIQRPVRISAAPACDPHGGNCSAGNAGEDFVVHFVRHGQGYHNLIADLYREAGREWNSLTAEGDNPYKRPEVVDPPLTELGRSQARSLQRSVDNLEVQLVVLSPLTRTTQTALLAFEHLIANASTSAKVPFVAHDGCHEIGGVHTCDRRRSLSELRRDFPAVDYQTASVREDDPLWSASHRETLPEVAARGYDFLLWLRQRRERNIAVVSHSTFLRTLFNAVLHCESPSLQDRLETGEMRSVRLTFSSE